MSGNFACSLDREKSVALGQRDRQDPRRGDDHCVGIVNGQMYPIRNWSNGGLLIVADERLFSIGQDCILTLKFKLRDDIIEVDNTAKVTRKSQGEVALRFDNTTPAMRADLQKVVDDFVTRRFADSQV